jgi:hypothetical protein
LAIARRREHDGVPELVHQSVVRSDHNDRARNMDWFATAAAQELLRAVELEKSAFRLPSFLP